MLSKRRRKEYESQKLGREIENLTSTVVALSLRLDEQEKVEGEGEAVCVWEQQIAAEEETSFFRKETGEITKA